MKMKRFIAAVFALLMIGGTAGYSAPAFSGFSITANAEGSCYTFDSETGVLTHDCTLPRPYSRGGVIQGTRGIWMEDNRSIYIEGMSPPDGGYWTHRWESDSEYMKKYLHPLWEEYEQFGLRGGHDGMDYLVLRAFVESVQNGTQPPIDVYDTAAWMSITALSEHSIAMGSVSVPVPDFTGGRWITGRKPVEGMYSLDL